jgi:hypothetical protein
MHTDTRVCVRVCVCAFMGTGFEVGGLGLKRWRQAARVIYALFAVDSFPDIGKTLSVG